MWRSGEALRPYFQDVLQLLRKLRELKAADPRAVPAISAPDATDFVHFPIVDCNVADDTKVGDGATITCRVYLSPPPVLNF